MCECCSDCGSLLLLSLLLLLLLLSVQRALAPATNMTDTSFTLRLVLATFTTTIPTFDLRSSHHTALAVQAGSTARSWNASAPACSRHASSASLVDVVCHT